MTRLPASHMAHVQTSSRARPAGHETMEFPELANVMGWPALAGRARARVRSVLQRQSVTSPQRTQPGQEVLNILGALKITRDTVYLFGNHGAHAIPVRIVDVDEPNRQICLERAATGRIEDVVLLREPLYLGGRLGQVCVLMLCRILDSATADGASCYRLDIPDDALHVQLREESRTRLAQEHGVGVTLPLPGECAPTMHPLHDLSDSGLSLQLAPGEQNVFAAHQELANAILTTPTGRICGLDLEVRHVTPADASYRMGARFRLLTEEDRRRLRCWIGSNRRPASG